jgi:eukaryotic-like serine/threonine-protein kinase
MNPAHTKDRAVLGETVGTYRIVEAIGAGGVGSVYRAEHVLLGKPAAVKVLKPEYSSEPEIVERFFNEAKLTTSIKHPGIVEVFDFGYTDDGHAYLVMELLEGMPLADQILARAPLREVEAAMLLRSVCNGLVAAHAKGVIHRDLKPDNIFVISDADSSIGVRTKILDFGIAKLASIGPAPRATLTGSVMGTPTYMSPEQCRGSRTLDERTDLYALGCIYYEMLTGRPPFTAEGFGELLAAHMFEEPAPPSQHVATISEAADELALTLLAKSPDDRVPSAIELVHRLTALAGVEPRRSREVAIVGDELALSLQRRRPKSTTLSSTASELTAAAPPRSRFGIALVAGAVLATGIIAGVALYGPSDDDDDAVTAPAAAPRGIVAPRGVDENRVIDNARTGDNPPPDHARIDTPPTPDDSHRPSSVKSKPAKHVLTKKSPSTKQPKQSAATPAPPPKPTKPGSRDEPLLERQLE